MAEKRTQWQKALDLVEQGKGVWGEHPQIGEVVLRPAPEDGGYIIVYPGRQGFINDVLQAATHSIKAHQCITMRFTILTVYDDPEAAAQSICTVREWNCQHREDVKGQSGYRFTRKSIPKAKILCNRHLVLSAFGEIEADITTMDALPACQLAEVR